MRFARLGKFVVTFGVDESDLQMPGCFDVCIDCDSDTIIYSYFSYILHR